MPYYIIICFIFRIIIRIQVFRLDSDPQLLLKYICWSRSRNQLALFHYYWFHHPHNYPNPGVQTNLLKLEPEPQEKCAGPATTRPITLLLVSLSAQFFINKPRSPHVTLFDLLDIKQIYIYQGGGL